MPNKSLGQHWLADREILSAIADEVTITKKDTVFEIGPGLGTLTSELLRRAEKVVAVEFDDSLADKLPGQFPGTNLTVIKQDILQFDIGSLPPDYIVVANVPYYITSKIVEKLLRADNKPRYAVLLVQQEVAERIAAPKGDLSLLGLSAQVYAEVRLGVLVSRDYFTPPPKVDSQVVVLKLRDTPLVPPEDERAFWRVARAGFSNKRKMLRSSIAAGLAISKPDADELLRYSGIDPSSRAQDITIDDWLRLARNAVG